MMLFYGIEIIYESIRKLSLKFAQSYANIIRLCSLKPADKRHLDEVVIRINGKQYYLWRAVDKNDQVIDILMQSRRDQCNGQKSRTITSQVLEHLLNID